MPMMIVRYMMMLKMISRQMMMAMIISRQMMMTMMVSRQMMMTMMMVSRQMMMTMMVSRQMMTMIMVNIQITMMMMIVRYKMMTFCDRKWFQRSLSPWPHLWQVFVKISKKFRIFHFSTNLSLGFPHRKGLLADRFEIRDLSPAF